MRFFFLIIFFSAIKMAWADPRLPPERVIYDFYEPGTSFLYIFPREPGEPILPSLLEEEKETSWEKYLSRGELLKLDPMLYRRVRRDLESGALTEEELKRREKVIEKKLAVPEEVLRLPGETPKPKPPELEIPAWEGKVNIAGRKLIAMNLATKKFLNPPHPFRPRLTPKNAFELRQELQLRVQGNVSDRVIVNIDYDDTKESKRDISIIYRGASGEAVKEISFGDITLNLPQTQFTSYSKQLFGIKGEFDFKRARLMVVGSQTKGTFALKRFSGQVQFETKDIQDISFVRRTYYDIAFDASHLPIAPGSVVIYRDDRIGTNNANAVTLTAEDYAITSSTYTGDFDLLAAGVDYIVDYQKGIVRFIQSQAANAVLAVDYTSAGGLRLSSTGTGKPKVLKTDADQPLVAAGEAGYRREMKTVYNIGQKKIVRDDGTGNFLFRILDKGNRQEVSGLTGIRYPDHVEVDFEEGTFRLTQTIPDPNTATSNHEIYDNPQASHYVFYLEYRFTVKTYTLQPNIVLQSEKIYRDGTLLTRDVDYFIDYDSGFLTFIRPELINPGTQIEVTYEVAPFGTSLAETLVGGRTEVDLLNNVAFGGFGFNKLSLGSSLLLQQAAKPATAPDIRSLPTSFSIYEGDMRMSGIRIPGPVRLGSNLQAEVAQSMRDPNTFGKAIVESMEGIKLEDAAAIHPSFWLPASNPSGVPNKLGALSVTEVTAKVKDINPAADATDSDTQSILRLDYDLSESSQASVVYVFSPIGLDFTSREFMEVTLQGDTTSGAPEISFQFGKISEDSDGDGILDTEDANNDGGLNFGEDIGYLYNNPAGSNPSSARIGANNGRIDTEDLDKNGRLDAEDPTVGGRFGLTAGSSATAVNFTAWTTTSVALGVANNLNAWTSIKVVRITLHRTPGGKTSGSIFLARLAVTGTRWERALLSGAVGAMRAGPINNADNPNYVPLFNAGGEAAKAFQDLYGGNTSPLGTKITTRRREQALRLEMTGFAASGSAPGIGSTRLNFRTAVKFESHRELNFFFHGPKSALAEGTTFFFRFGSSSDYYEYRLALNQTALVNNWFLLKINLEDNNRDGIVDQASPAHHAKLSAQIVRKGNPNMANVTDLTMGIEIAPGAASVTDEIWINDIYLSDSREKKGVARYLAMDFDLPGWMTFGGVYKNYDRNFEGLGQGSVNQDYLRRSAFLNFTRLRFMPFSGQGARETVITPSAIQTGPSNLVSLLQEGRVERFSLAGSGSFVLPRLPALSWTSSRDKSDNLASGRIDDIYNYAGSFSMGSPLGLRFISNWSNNYSRRNKLLKFSKPLRLAGNDNLKEFTDTWNTQMGLNFLAGRLNLSPSYGFSATKETRKHLSPEDVLHLKTYPKSLSQNVSLGMSLRLWSWISPTVNFSSVLNENHRVESASFTLAGVPEVFERGDIKTITRQGNLSINQTFEFARLFPKFKPFYSFSHSAGYSLSDGDTYENVHRDFRALDKLWIRQPLEMASPGARRTNQTLRDTVNVSSRWAPFVALFEHSPWKTLSLTNNFSHSLERAETTGTERKNLSLTLPDLLVSLEQIERLLHTSRWMNSARLNSRYSRNKQLTFNVSKTLNLSMGGDLSFLLRRFYDVALHYNQNQSSVFHLATHATSSRSKNQNGSAQVGFNWKAWRFTGRMGVARNKAVDAIGRLTTDSRSINPSITARGDFSLPTGLALPFSSKRFTFTNRVILTSNLAWDRKSSSINVEHSNTDEWNWNLNGDFEIGKNLRAGLGSGLQWFKNRVLPDQDFYTVNINAQIIFQF